MGTLITYLIISITTMFIFYFIKLYLINKYPKYKLFIQIFFAIIDFAHLMHLIYILL